MKVVVGNTARRLRAFVGNNTYTPTFLTLVSLANTDIPSTQRGLVLIMSTIRMLLMYIDLLP